MDAKTGSFLEQFKMSGIESPAPTEVGCNSQKNTDSSECGGDCDCHCDGTDCNCN